MDKMREEFEAWYSDFDGYGEAHKKELWDTWKASRDALCVELPDSWTAGELGDDANVISAVEIMASLEDAGVSYK